LRLLVLGGTLFLGRHVVEAALDGGHDVTLFTRGRTNPDAFPEVERLAGDRDGDLSASRVVTGTPSSIPPATHPELSVSRPSCWRT
jgi:nucleoside-diphosphate-sugar epimerase